MRYDVIVVGAGPAGCAAAYDLVSAGRTVLLIDRRRFPRVKPCAGAIAVRSQKRLRYSIAPVVRVRCPAFRYGRRLEETRAFNPAVPAVDAGDYPTCAMTVRSEFDDYCLRQTVARGAHFRVIRHIEALKCGADEIEINTTDGVVRAEYLIGADGASSVVRRLVANLPPLLRGFAIEAQLRMQTPPPPQFDFGMVACGYGWVFPKGDHVNVGLYTNNPSIHFGRAELKQYAEARLGSADLHEVVGHHLAFGASEASLAVERVLFVGDAAGLVDPFYGEGISGALASGQAAAAALVNAAGSTALEVRQAYVATMRPLIAETQELSRFAKTFYSDVDAGYRAGFGSLAPAHTPTAE